VHRSARGHGIGAALMAEVEAEARRRAAGCWCWTRCPAENGHRLYQRAGWTQTGLVLITDVSDGRLCDTAIMWKRAGQAVGWAKRSVPTTQFRSMMTWARRKVRLCPPYDCWIVMEDS